MSSTTRSISRALTLGAAATLVLTLTACGQDTSTTTGATASTSSSTTPETTEGAAAVVLEDGWVKASDDAMAFLPHLDSVLLIAGAEKSRLDEVDAAGLDRRVLARRGAQAVLKMIVEDGLFHA